MFAAAMNKLVLYIIFGGLFLISIFSETGCANIVPPSGGPRDSLPPILIAANPKDSALNVNTQKITLVFNEFVNSLTTVSEKILISPFPAKNPIYESKLKSVTVRLKDSLLPNTTYSIDFGDAISDLNENNILKNFRFTFSTGSTIDTNELRGKIILAETGTTDSTMFALLYTKQEDSTVAKETPRYVARVDAKGNFHFTNLPAGTFFVYALLDADGNKKYNQPFEQFAFLDSPVVINASTKPVLLYAYAAEKEKKREATETFAKGELKTLKHTSNIESNTFDFLDSLELSYKKPIRKLDVSKISLVQDSAANITDFYIRNDSINKKLIIQTSWKQGSQYILYLNKEYATDSSGLAAAKNDTLKFRVKTEKEYGTVRVRFKNVDTAANPVLLVYANNQFVAGYPFNGKEFYSKLFKPGSYNLSILYDKNQNGIWDPGEYFAKQKRQPEIVTKIHASLTIKANWDNETNIDMNQPPPAPKETGQRQDGF